MPRAGTVLGILLGVLAIPAALHAQSPVNLLAAPQYAELDSVRNTLLGTIVAAALAISASDATIFGIAAWKIVLAASGAVIFVAGSEAHQRGKR